MLLSLPGRTREPYRLLWLGEEERKRGEGRRREVKEEGRAGREGETLVKIFLVHRTNSVHLGFGELDNILCTAPK